MKTMTSPRGAAVLWALLVGVFAQQLFAAAVTVSPVRLLITKGKSTTTMTVKNVGTATTLFHLETQAWTQDAGKDRTEATNEILAMPPIFDLAPGATQVVRIALRRAREEQRELTYRIFITEVPDETSPGSAGIRTTTRISVPVFVRPDRKAAPTAEFSLHHATDANLRLTVVNSGAAHILIGRVKLFRRGSGEEPLHDSAIAGYVLAGQSRSWTLALSKPIGDEPVVLKAETDDGIKEAVLAVAAP